MSVTVKIEYQNNRLKTLREERGLSQSKLSELCGINARVLQNYEQGVRNLNGAKLLTLLSICDALGCRLEDLVDDPRAVALLHKLYQP